MTKQKTYSGYWESGGREFDKISPSELFNKIPAGARLSSGNKLNPQTGDIVEY